MNVLILVVDDEPDVEMLFRQQFRRDLRAGRSTREFAQSAPAALQCISDASNTSLILVPSGHQYAWDDRARTAAKGQGGPPDVPVIMITAYGDEDTKRKALQGGAMHFLPSLLISRCSAARSICVSSGRHRRRHPPGWIGMLQCNRLSGSRAGPGAGPSGPKKSATLA